MPKVVLVGPMGAGKSTVAALLAEQWGAPLRDVDTEIEAAEGRPISDIFVDDGEAHFRALERAAVATVLDDPSAADAVVALGGGAVLDETTRERLTGHPVVFLRVGFADAVKRVGLGSSRPLLLGNVRSRTKALLEERAPLYDAVAVHTVDTDERTPAEVAAEVTRLLS